MIAKWDRQDQQKKTLISANGNYKRRKDCTTNI